MECGKLIRCNFKTVDEIRYIRYLTCLFMILGSSSCAIFPSIYSGEAVYGWLVDAETKEPIKNALVIITMVIGWPLDSPG